jgi:hypothetical protein
MIVELAGAPGAGLERSVLGARRCACRMVTTAGADDEFGLPARVWRIAVLRCRRDLFAPDWERGLHVRRGARDRSRS